MIDLVAGFAVVAGALDRVGVPYVVVGSMAAARWGVARTTRDIDLVLVADVTTVDELLAALDRTDIYVPSEAARDALTLGGSFNVLHTASGTKIDVFAVEAQDAFERSRLERRIPAEVLGIASWVATAEDVVLSKLRWRLESRSEVQWRDCVEIAEVHDLDREYLSAWADELGVSADLRELLGDGSE